MRALCVAAAAAALIVFAATPARAALTEVEQRDRILLEVSHAEEQDAVALLDLGQCGTGRGRREYDQARGGGAQRAHGLAPRS